MPQPFRTLSWHTGTRHIPAMLLIATVISILLLSPAAIAIDISRFAHNNNFVDVTDYGAIPNDGKDDTDSLQKAFSSTDRHIFFPEGTYLVSNTVYIGSLEDSYPYNTWDGKLVQGAGTDKTIIKLDDDAPGFDDPTNPKTIFSFFHEDKTLIDNQFGDMLKDITIDANSHPGAVGINFYTSNFGGLSNVKCISSGGTRGLYGIKNQPTRVGPGVFTDIVVEDYETGIALPGNMHGYYLENITINNFTTRGLYSTQRIAIRNYTAENGTGPAIEGRNYSLIDSRLAGNGDYAAIAEGGAYLRNVDIDGYTNAIHHKTDSFDTTLAGETGFSYMGDRFGAPLHSPFAQNDTLMHLPVKDMPAAVNQYDNPADWTDSYDYGGNIGKEDDGQNQDLQDALDATNGTLAITNCYELGYYTPVDPSLNVTDPQVRVGGNVDRIIRIGKGYNNYEKFDPQHSVDELTWIIEGNASDGPLIFEDFTRGIGKIIHASDRTVVFINVGMKSYENTVEGGNVFIQNGAGDDIYFKGQHVWLRYGNPEGIPEYDAKIVNDGGRLWVGYIKTEDEGTAIATINNGFTEMLQGFFYATHAKNRTPDAPCLYAEDSHVSYALAGYSYSNSMEYSYYSIIRRNGQSDTVDTPLQYSFICDYTQIPEAAVQKIIPGATGYAPYSLTRYTTHLRIEPLVHTAPYSVSIFNASGQCLFFQQRNKNDILTIPSSRLPYGNYYLLLRNLSTGREMSTRWLIQ